MAFSVQNITLGDLNFIRISNLNTLCHIDISCKGGLLNSWVQGPEKQGFDVIDGNDFSIGWGAFESNGFKSGKMNPYSCRLNKGCYIHNNKEYKINKYYLGVHSIHGLVYDANFVLEHSEVKDNQASVSLVYQYQKQDTGFPFEYEIKLNWVFEQNNKVSVTTTILNNSAESFPMMDGWHPYFKLGESINDCAIWFSDQGLLAYDLELIPTGNIIPHNTFANGQSLLNITLDNGYVLNPQNVDCILENNNYKLVVTPISNYGYLQLYTPPHRKSIAIENLSAAPDCFNNKMGLHIMQPQEIWSLKTQYQLFYK